MTEPIVDGLRDQATVGKRVDSSEAPGRVADRWQAPNPDLLAGIGDRPASRVMR